MTKSFPFISVCFAILLLAACSNQQSLKSDFSPKTLPNDPYAVHMPEAQQFELKMDQDTAIVAEHGTSIVAFKNSFIYPDGKPYSGTVRLNLTENLTMYDMLRSGLNTISDKGELLQTGGMLHLEVQDKDGKELLVNPEAPLYVQVPTDKVVPGMQLYSGKRDTKGKLTWTDPEPLRSVMTTVPLEELDFLPPGFRDEVEKMLPLWGHSVADDALVDSIYYALSAVMFSEEGESYKFCDNPNRFEGEGLIQGDSIPDEHTIALQAGCTIEPAQIKTLQQAPFQNSFVATTAFAERVAALHKTCGKEALDLYIHSLDKELWEVDQEVANLLTKPAFKKRFEDFAAQKLTNVAEADQYAQALKKVFDRLVKKNRKDLSKAAKALAKQDRREQKQFEQVEKKYNKMLWKREVRLMTSYGFKNTRTGWINIDKPRRGKEIGIEIPLVATVKDADEFELVTVYAVFPYIKCLNAFKKTGTNTFGPDISDRNTIPVATTKQSIIIAIAHKGEKTYYAEEVFTGGKRQTFNLELEEISQQELQRAIGQFDDFPQNSNIRKDQEFQKKKLTKLRRDKQRRKEQFAMEALFYFVTNPCLKIDFNADVVNGERLYKENCASCHKPIGKLVGPQLAGVFQKYTMQMDWRFMIEFTRNSPQLIKDGDPKAVALWNEYNQAAMQAFPTLSDQDIVDILAFCDAIEYAE